MTSDESVIASDRKKGLINAVAANFSLANHIYDPRHLVQNAVNCPSQKNNDGRILENTTKFRESNRLVWIVITATTVSGHFHALTDLSVQNPGCGRYLEKTEKGEKSRWAHFKLREHGVKLHGQCGSNMSEQENARAKAKGHRSSWDAVLGCIIGYAQVANDVHAKSCRDIEAIKKKGDFIPEKWFTYFEENVMKMSAFYVVDESTVVG